MAAAEGESAPVPGDPRGAALTLVARYYAAFNAGDWAGMLACLTEDVAHDINQGDRRIGRDDFARFLSHMERCYREQLSDMVLMASDDGRRASAEFIVHGNYLVTDEGLPPAAGQAYSLPAGAFFDIADGLIRRVSVYYNLADWTRQVSG